MDEKESIKRWYHLIVVYIYHSFFIRNIVGAMGRNVEKTIG